MILQDGGAHKLVWHCKGDAGTKMCMLCRNLISQRSRIASEDGSALLKFSVVHESELDFATDADIRGTIARLAHDAATLSKEMLKLKQQACGFNHEPHGLLMDQNLQRIVKPAGQFCHDWMHGVLYNGVFQTSLYLCLVAFQAAGFPDLYDRIVSFFDVWEPPHHQRALNKALWTKKAWDSHKKAGIFKCNASEALGMYSILSVFIASIILPWGQCLSEAAAFLALSDVLDLLQATPLQIVNPNHLRESSAAFLKACETAGWREHMQPKFHWLVHFPLHLARFGILPSCFVHERKHKLVKRYSNDVFNTSTFEKSIYSQILSSSFHSLQTPDLFTLKLKLLSPKQASAEVKSLLEQQLGDVIPEGECWVANGVKLPSSSECFKGDVVCLKASPGEFDIAQIFLHISISGKHASLVSKWAPLERDPVAGTLDVQVSQTLCLIDTDDLIASTSWCRKRPGVVRLIVPYAARV